MSNSKYCSPVQNEEEFRNWPVCSKLMAILLLGFVLSLPFNGIEFQVSSISRFEIKITMITFSLLFIAWLSNNLKFLRRRDSKEIIFYSFALMYVMAQFASLINSPFPFESIKQGIIILSLITMMIVISETISDKKMAEYVLTAIGTLSLLIGVVAALNYYLINDYPVRLGQSGGFVLGIIDLGGDPYYFGDLLLYSIGSVFFVALKFSKRKYWRWLIPLFLMLWFSSIVLTFTKALILSVGCFLICSILLLKGRRVFMLLTTILFIVMIVFNMGVNTYLDIRSRQESISKQVIIKNLMIYNRTNVFSTVGKTSFSIRLKAIKLSLKSSLENKWFGHGAGLSQKLLPMIANEYDRTAGEKEREAMKSMWIYGENVNKSLIDSHVLLLTEFFNVGLVGLISLMCLIVFIIVKQVKTIGVFKDEKDNMNELLFATLISMLVYRLAGSLIAIPFLWFMLGLSFGVCKLYRKV